MNLRAFHYVLAVSETLSFKAAADFCHVSQPSLSMQIKKIEDLWGVQLFERTNKSVRVTETGRRLIEIMRRIVSDEKMLSDAVSGLRTPGSGEFRLGAFPTLASYVFPSFVPALSKIFPHLQLLLLEEKTNILLDRLINGKIDAALLALPIVNSRLCSEPIFEDPFYLAVGPDHPLAHRKTVRVSDMDGHKLLLLDEGHCLRDQALAFCQANGADEEKRFRATSLETLRLMVRQPRSGLMTLLPGVALSPGDGLRTIPFIGKAPSRSIGLVWRKTDARQDMMFSFVRCFKRARPNVSRKNDKTSCLAPSPPRDAPTS